MKIQRFRDAYGFLSNFHEAPVCYGGLTYGNAEAAFQAQKCMSREQMVMFTQMRPAKAKKAGRQVALRPDWEQVKVPIMEEIVLAKFSQNEELKYRLIGTGDAILEEGNTWNDTFWGMDAKTGKGENHLGRILMEVRARLREEEMV